MFKYLLLLALVSFTLAAPRPEDGYIQHHVQVAGPYSGPNQAPDAAIQNRPIVQGPVHPGQRDDTSPFAY